MAPTMAGPKRRVIEGVLASGHKGTAVAIPFDPGAEWGTPEIALWPGRRGYPVEVLLGVIRFRSAIVCRMRPWFLLVDESLARRAGLSVGDIAKPRSGRTLLSKLEPQSAVGRRGSLQAARQASRLAGHGRRSARLAQPHAAEQGDEADEAFGGTASRWASMACVKVPPHARAVPVRRGHRFAAYPRCSADTGSSERTKRRPARTGGPSHR
jgi:hypothetical protein